MNLTEHALCAAIDNKTKPPGSLGRVESLARQIGALQQSLQPRMERCQLTIFAADHGIAVTGVSQYPQEVTAQMVGNFLAGGAAANVFARAVGVEVQVVDAGVAGPAFDSSQLLDRRIAAGTRNSSEQAAMSDDQLSAALRLGRDIGAAGDWDAMCFGEMGIGNTSSASLLFHKILGLSLDDLTGRGTGLDDEGLARKRVILSRAAARVPGTLGALDALREFGGFEIAMMCGAMLSAAGSRRLVIVDGFIATAAALAAMQIEPECRNAMVFAHRSAERGHAAVIDAIGAEPLLDLDLRLGEGTGALLAWPLVKSAAAMLREMASFESAGVSGPA